MAKKIGHLLWINTSKTIKVSIDLFYEKNKMAKKKDWKGDPSYYGVCTAESVDYKGAVDPDGDKTEIYHWSLSKIYEFFVNVEIHKIIENTVPKEIIEKMEKEHVAMQI